MAARRKGRLARWAAALGRLLVGVAALALTSVMSINLGVAVCGETLVNPLSLSFLEKKAGALARYARHRATCVRHGDHPPMGPLIAQAARRHRVDPQLLAALVEVESGSKPHRISAAGAMGPAQLIATTAQLMGVDDPFDPEQALDGGARYLRQMLDRFDDDPALALAGYNAGPGSVVGRRVPRNGETEHYVQRVLALWRQKEGRRR